MNIQLHRKQMVILGLAMVLAVASYWIPVPQKPVSPLAAPTTSKTIGQLESVTPMVFSRELATSQRFSVAESFSQLPVSATLSREIEDSSLGKYSSNQSFLSAYDFGNNKAIEVDAPLLISVKNPKL